MIREEVKRFVELGPLPASDAEEATIAQHEDALASITPPLSKEEAILLLGQFGPDECFGLAWTLIHLLESTAGGVPLYAVTVDNEWTRILRQRAARV